MLLNYQNDYLAPVLNTWDLAQDDSPGKRAKGAHDVMDGAERERAEAGAAAAGSCHSRGTRVLVAPALD